MSGLSERDVERVLRDVMALADKWDARYGPFPNGFCRSLTIHEATGTLRALVAERLAGRSAPSVAASEALADALHNGLHPDSLSWRDGDADGSDRWVEAEVGEVIDAVLASDWLAERDAAIRDEAKAEALREAADQWTQGRWSDVMLPKPVPPAVPVIDYSNRVGEWLRECAALLDGGDQR